MLLQTFWFFKEFHPYPKHSLLLHVQSFLPPPSVYISASLSLSLPLNLSLCPSLQTWSLLAFLCLGSLTFLFLHLPPSFLCLSLTVRLRLPFAFFMSVCLSSFSAFLFFCQTLFLSVSLVLFIFLSVRLYVCFLPLRPFLWLSLFFPLSGCQCRYLVACRVFDGFLHCVLLSDSWVSRVSIQLKRKHGKKQNVQQEKHAVKNENFHTCAKTIRLPLTYKTS